MIEHPEGRRAFPYHDIVGELTIGIERNLTDRGWSDNEINFIFISNMRPARQIWRRRYAVSSSFSPA